MTGSTARSSVRCLYLQRLEYTYNQIIEFIHTCKTTKTSQLLQNYRKTVNTFDLYLFYQWLSWLEANGEHLSESLVHFSGVWD